MPTYQIIERPETPPEQVTGLLYGLFGHLGSPVFYIILLAIFGVNTATAIGFFLLTSAVFLCFTLACERLHPSIELPELTSTDWIGGLSVLFYKGILIGGGFVALGWWLFSHLPLWGDLRSGWGFIAAATLLTDLGYYWIHRALSHGSGRNPIVRYYRKKHSAHHSISELDFMRGNQSSLVDTALSQFQPSLILISWLLGMDLAPTLVAYGLILALQATDHTSVTFNIGFLKYIFMDNHAHKLHHCRRGELINHAAAFSIYDRLWGTYYEDWSLSSNYLHHHRIPLPIKSKRRRTRSTQKTELSVT